MSEPINVGRDMQIGIYVLVLDALGKGPIREAGYISPDTGATVRRTFDGESLSALRQSARLWLSQARVLFVHGMFPRTPHVRDCHRCPFRPACGTGAQQQSAAKLAGLAPAHPLHSFRDFKRLALGPRSIRSEDEG